GLVSVSPLIRRLAFLLVALAGRLALFFFARRLHFGSIRQLVIAQCHHLLARRQALRNLDEVALLAAGLDAFLMGGAILNHIDDLFALAADDSSARDDDGSAILADHDLSGCELSNF